jgi:ABC-type transport system involved in multi-copper enzyme maturation permease subunit
MVGPLIYHEMLLGSRRSRDHVFRWVYACWLLATLLWCMFVDWILYLQGALPFGYTPQVSRDFVDIFIPQHFILLLLVTPAFVASAVTEEKTKGTLQYLLTTDLAPVHIIAGKLVGRIVQVSTLALTGLPLLALLGALSGVEPALLFGLVVTTVFVAAGVASATFLAAVWARQTRDAVLGLYAAGVVAVTAVVTVGGPLAVFNPIALLEPLVQSGGAEGVLLVGRQLFVGLLAWGGLTATCLGLAAWRLRPAYIRQLQAQGRPSRRRWLQIARPLIGTEPMRWKEQHVEGLAPVPWMRQVPRWLGVAVTAVATIVSSCAILYALSKPGVTGPAMLDKALHLRFSELADDIDGSASGDGFLTQAVLAMNLFALLVAVRCSGSVTNERERQTWDALLLTPLTVEQLIRGKLWGIMRVSYVYLAAYAIPALLLALLAGAGAVFWTLVYLGETLLAMYYLGAVGMWSSVRARSSWRSLLLTVLVAYAAGVAIFVCLTPLVLIISWILYGVLWLIGNHLGLNAGNVVGSFATFATAFLIATCIGLVALFWFTARLFLRGAQQWIADRERTRHWEDDPTVPRRRRRRRRVAPPSGV